MLHVSDKKWATLSNKIFLAHFFFYSNKHPFGMKYVTTSTKCNKTPNNILMRIFLSRKLLFLQKRRVMDTYIRGLILHRVL